MTERGLRCEWLGCRETPTHYVALGSSRQPLEDIWTCQNHLSEVHKFFDKLRRNSGLLIGTVRTQVAADF